MNVCFMKWMLIDDEWMNEWLWNIFTLVTQKVFPYFVHKKIREGGRGNVEDGVREGRRSGLEEWRVRGDGVDGK